MSYPTPFNIATGSADGWRSIKIEGRNTAVGQVFVPVTPSGVYRTPQAGDQVQLRVRAGGNANDTATGTGAREIEIYGIDVNGLEVTDTIPTAGSGASIATTQFFIRILSARVSKSGRYANQTAASHFADIVIESTTGELWASIPLNGFGESISRIGAFTVPFDHEAFLIGLRINASAGKTVDAILFKRENILQTAVPYSPMVVITSVFNITGFEDLSYDAPLYLPPLTDVGVMAVINTQTARVGCGIGLLLRRVR